MCGRFSANVKITKIQFIFRKCIYNRTEKQLQLHESFVGKSGMRISGNTTRPGIACSSDCLERKHGISEQFNTFDCLRMDSKPVTLRKTQSAIDLTKLKVSSSSPMKARSIAFLWRRPAENQAAEEDPKVTRINECTSPEDIKQRWRRQQIAIQQQLAVPEKKSFWSMLTRSRRCLPRKMGNWQRT